MLSYVLIFITIFLFSTIEVFSKIINGEIDPIYLAFLRFFISGTLILLFNIKKIKLIEKNDVIKLIVWGIIGVSLALSFFHLSLKTLEASQAAVIFSLNPLFSSIAAVFILKEKFKIKNIFGILFGIIGTYIMIFGFEKFILNEIYGVLLMFLSAILFGIYVVAAKSLSKKYGAIFTTGILFFIGSLFYIPFIKDYNIEGGAETYFIILYLILIATGLAYIFYFYGLRKVNVSAGTSMFFIKPVLASVFSVIFLKEKLYINFYIGVLLIMTALFISIKKFEIAKLKLHDIKK